MRLRGISALLGVGAIVATALVLAGPAAATGPYPCGTTFDASGTYHIYYNQTYSGTCYTIAADNVTLVFHNGAYIHETSASSTVIDDSGYCGTGSDPCNGFTLMNATIDGGSTQVEIEGNSTLQTHDNNVIGSTLTDGYYGIYTEYATDTLIKGNTIGGTGAGAEYGIYLDYADTTDVLAANTITDSGSDGIYVDYSAGIVISGNTISGSGEYGIEANDYNAGLAINGNFLDGNDTGLYIYEDAGDQIANNWIQGSSNEGVYDEYSDLNSYTGNVVTDNYDSNFYLYPYDYGPVTMVNNMALGSQDGYGVEVYEAFNSGAYGGPFSLFTGNQAIGNTDGGFYDEAYSSYQSSNETWTKNSAWYNGGIGFYFDEPTHFVINGNSAAHNGDSGFYIDDADSSYTPVSFSGNTAQYNLGYGFEANYPVAGSGNLGSSNANGACYLVAGCSGT